MRRALRGGGTSVGHSRENEFEEGARRALDTLVALAAELRAAECELLPLLSQLPAEAQASAKNLVHYVALRRVDLRGLQNDLTQLGLSSLGRAEGDVLGAIDAVCRMLQRALALPTLPGAPGRRRLSGALRKRARAMFGDAPPPAVMVTMPSSAAHDPAFIRALLESGMHVLRVNSAHEDEDALRAIVRHLRQAELDTGKRCMVVVDLAGPKLRTLALEPGARVLKLKPRKGERGDVIEPASVILRASAGRARSEPAPGEVLVRAAFLSVLAVGDVIVLVDARGKRRKLSVTALSGELAHCSVDRTTYLDERATLSARRDGKKLTASRPLRIRARENHLTLRAGDVLELRKDRSLGHGPRLSKNGEIEAPASIACGLPALIQALLPGHRVLFDDGKILAVVEDKSESSARLRIVRTQGESAKLRAEKGINVPDTELALPALTEPDRAMVRVAAEVADMVALSFVRSAEDVRQLHRELARLRADLGIVLKIETQRGFEALPAILLEALKRPRVAVMIARGDLAVECGFERLAELQEEMLWLCEASHVPIIWATQVLETLAKEGQATRAEVTDAAMAERAECVMLNKGPFVLEALRTLHDILARMRGHQEKKRSTLRPLLSPRLGAAAGT